MALVAISPAEIETTKTSEFYRALLTSFYKGMSLAGKHDFFRNTGISQELSVHYPQLDEARERTLTQGDLTLKCSYAQPDSESFELYFQGRELIDSRIPSTCPLTTIARDMLAKPFGEIPPFEGDQAGGHRYQPPNPTLKNSLRHAGKGLQEFLEKVASIVPGK